MCKCSPLVQSPISKAFQSFIRLEMKTVYMQTPDATFPPTVLKQPLAS